MLRYLFCITFCVITASAFSQNFYGIIFTNTNDKTIGKSATKNTENISSLLSEIATNLNFTPKITVFNGKNYTYEKLDSVLKNFTSSDSDVVFFYINSHGYKSSTSSQFPRIYIPSKKYGSRYLVSADQINRAFEKKSSKAGSLITVFQACNRLLSKSQDLPIDTLSLVKNISLENYKKLFLSRQNIIVTSSQRGKTSIATPDKGSYFTQSFVKAMHLISEEPNAITWEQVLQKSKKYSLMLDNTRYPVWNISKIEESIQNPVDTLSPSKVLYDSSIKASQIVFDEVEMPLNTTNRSYLSLISNSIKSNRTIAVRYDPRTYTITSLKLLNIKREVITTLEKTSDTSRLIQEIPLDSLQNIFDYFVSLSCTQLGNCDLESPCLTFDYKQNGCNARAHWMRKILSEKFGYSCEKIFVESNKQLLTVLNDGSCGNSCIKWGWHVAVYVRTVSAEGHKSNLVIDPSLFKKPATVDEWVEIQRKSCCATCSVGNPMKPFIRPSNQNSPNGHLDNVHETKALLFKFCKKCH